MDSRSGTIASGAIREARVMAIFCSTSLGVGWRLVKGNKYLSNRVHASEKEAIKKIKSIQKR